MAKKQTRRSISVSRPTYEDLKSYSKESGVPMSAVVETLLKRFLKDSDPVKKTENAMDALGTVQSAVNKHFTS